MCSRCSLNSVDPMVLSPLPEILYYYQTWCFLGLPGANYNDWISIHDELLNTCIHINGSNLSKTQYRLRQDLDLCNFGHGAFWESSLHPVLLSVGL